MWKKTIFAILIIFLCQSNLNKADDGIDWYMYYKMPLLHHNDDYLQCIYETRDGYNIYCTTHSIIKPDNTSALWRYIEEYSSDKKRHLAHDLFMTGMCIKRCERDIAALSEEEQDALYVPQFPWRVRYDYDFTAFQNTTNFRKKYSRITNQCVNLWLKKNYNLTAYSSIQFCTDNHESEYYEYGLLHVFFIIVLLTIIGVISSATLYDMRLNKANKGLSHYKEDLTGLSIRQSALLCFSFTRNWYRLTSPPKDEFGRDFRFFLAVRYCTTLLVVFGHIVIGFSFAPNVRPEYIELTYHRVSSLVQNCGTTIVQTFFISSGFLVYAAFTEVLKENQVNTKFFIIAFFYRYLRLTPVYGFLILFHATFLYPLGTGSFWKPFAQVEQTYCRRYWWSHLLYINNYVNPKQQCMIQTWYLAADTQLFVFALFLFTFMWKYPKYKKHILGGVFFVSCVIQFFVTYINEYDGIYFMWPEAKRFLLDNVYEEFEKDYIATHTNAGNFIIGIALAMLYFHVKKNKIDYNKFAWFPYAWNAVFIFGISFLFSITWLFINYDFPKPSIWISLLAVVTRNFWGFIGIIFVMGFISSLKSPIKNFFNWHAFIPLSRLTYCIYLCHMTVGRYLFGGLIERIDLTDGQTIVYTIALFVTSNMFALVLCLCLEFPVTALSKELFRGQRAKFDEERRREREQNGHSNELSKL